MSKSDEFRVFCKIVDGIFQRMGGFKKSADLLKLLFYAAFSNYSILKKADIPTIRTFKNNLLDLLEVSKAFTETGILREADDLMAFSEISGLPSLSLYWDRSAKKDTPWDLFPRHINRNEFLKPLDGLQTIFDHKSLQDWKIIIEELFSSALLQQSMFEFSGLIDNAVEIHDDLFKLIEITHIIKVRRPYLDF